MKTAPVAEGEEQQNRQEIVFVHRGSCLDPEPGGSRPKKSPSHRDCRRNADLKPAVPMAEARERRGQAPLTSSRTPAVRPVRAEHDGLFRYRRCAKRGRDEIEQRAAGPRRRSHAAARKPSSIAGTMRDTGTTAMCVFRQQAGRRCCLRAGGETSACRFRRSRRSSR